MLLIQKQGHYNITEQRAQAFFAILSRQAHFIEGTGNFTTRGSDLLFRRERLAIATIKKRGTLDIGCITE
ncbi:MAG: hypothetical protein LUC40_00860, partial [Oscillospiraceae bacterium]|nr:hypothetical protein [Oscillospiraceae bacterium]